MKPQLVWFRDDLPDDDIFNPSSHWDPNPTEQEWLVPAIIPHGEVVLLYGAGGVGKSLLALQLMTCCATGHPFLGLPVQKCSAFGLFSEESRSEINRRINSILRHLGIEPTREGYDQLIGMGCFVRPQHDNALMRFDKNGVGKLTPYFDEFCAHAMCAIDAPNNPNHSKRQGFIEKRGLIVIDNLVSGYDGNENDRRQVQVFVRECLYRIARELNVTVIVLANPSNYGLSSGTGSSGSTGWENAARSRLYLRRPKAGGALDPSTIILEVMKSNYGPTGGQMHLKIDNGVFVPVGSGPSIKRSNPQFAEDTFLKCLHETQRQGRDVSASPNAANFAPKSFSEMPRSEGLSKIELRRGMERLLDQGRIKVEEYGRAGDRRKRLVT